jgi:hypothetical protein
MATTNPAVTGISPDIRVTDASGVIAGLIRRDGASQAIAPPTGLLNSAGLVSVAVLGDSIARNHYSPRTSAALAGTIRAVTTFGAWGAFAAYLSSGRAFFDVYACEGYSGQQTHEIFNSLLSSTATETYGVAETIGIGVANRKPSIVFEIAGTNDMIFAVAADITSGAALRRAIAGRRALWAYIRSWGGRPIAVSLFPRQGTFSAAAGAMTQNQLKPFTAEWNAAFKAAADADGVDWLDAYTPCAVADGGWRAGFIFNNGSDDPQGIHPSYLASLEVGRAGGAMLQRIIGGAPLIPRLELGGNPIYSASFVAGSRRQAFANFGDGTLVSTAGWASRFDPQADSSFGVNAPTQDLSGGQTLRFVKPANTGSRYADWSGPTLTVAAGQEYVLFADMRSRQVDSFASGEISVVDRTSGSGSPFQPIAALSIQSRRAPDGVATDSGLLRVLLTYRVPTGINSVSPLIAINRSAGGGAVGQDEVYISNIGQLRLA